MDACAQSAVVYSLLVYTFDCLNRFNNNIFSTLGNSSSSKKLVKTLNEKNLYPLYI